MAIADIYQCRVFCLQSNQFAINDMKYYVTGENGAGATPSQIAKGLSFNVAAEYKAVLTTTSTYYGVTAQKIFPGPRGIRGSDVTDQGAGSLANSVIPPQVAALISFRSAKTTVGKGTRCRIYVPFVNEDSIAANGLMTAGSVTLYNAIGTGFLASITAGDGAGNDSTLQAVALDGDGAAWSLVSRTTNSYLATQRRRSYLSGGDDVPF